LVIWKFLTTFRVVEGGKCVQKKDYVKYTYSFSPPVISVVVFLTTTHLSLVVKYFPFYWF
jgi:hypothetical protein